MFPPVWRWIHFNWSLPKLIARRQVINIPKLSEEDTTLTVGNAAGEKRTIPVLKGVRISIDAPGLHYNREGNLLVWGCLLWLIFL